MTTEQKTESPTKGLTTRVDIELYRRLKVAAVMRDKKIGDCIIDAVRLWLETENSDGSTAGA